ncbi:UvrD-helicase domain-containing protein [Pseudomonas syringae]|uniref:UvrD-helicase domain-containing protein n=1 Tax=Pseudomonas syringae TaxID=317 RepID=UPI00130475D2|nr:UvrD-helicase domain-containing protein [Pseudomonas syringae]
MGVMDKTPNPVVQQIFEYMDLSNPQSFLLFAGAGSGKTRTLVESLELMKERYAAALSSSGKKIGIITYTNAASEEIKRRLFFDANFMVSTIHSFCWDLIKPFTNDIRIWVEEKLVADIEKLTSAISKSRTPQGVTAIRNQRSLVSKKKRLAGLDEIRSFTYSPASSRPDKGALNHAEVLGLAAHLLASEALLRKILWNRFPILLIDESQDTNKGLLESLIATQQENPHQFCLGLFGDMMQRIYSGGKSDLASPLPDGWKSPAIEVNYRCPIRIVELINKIRIIDDEHQQTAASSAENGTVRLFLVDTSVQKDKSEIECTVAQLMAKCTGDDAWTDSESVTALTLEHHMAAKRGGFSDFFLPFLEVERLRDAAINGESEDIRFLTLQFVPLIVAIRREDDFEIATIMRRYSPLLAGSNLVLSDDPISVLRTAQVYIDRIKLALDSDVGCTIIEICSLLKEGMILRLPETFAIHLGADLSINLPEDDVDDVNDKGVGAEHNAWKESLSASTNQLENYVRYVSSSSAYDTHQGVKGLQFPRVMVILDDEDARGFLFSYEKLLGAVPLSATDITNENAGEDSSPKRSRRLFYVTCSRAKESLAVVAYTKAPKLVAKTVSDSGWFHAGEIVSM